MGVVLDGGDELGFDVVGAVIAAALGFAESILKCLLALRTGPAYRVVKMGGAKEGVAAGELADFDVVVVGIVLGVEGVGFEKREVGVIGYEWLKMFKEFSPVFGDIRLNGLEVMQSALDLNEMGF